MPTRYKVTVNTTTKKNVFHIVWKNIETREEKSFNQPAEINQEEYKKLWQYPEHQLSIGRKLFVFLNGDHRFFQLALNEAAGKGESLIIYLCTCEEITDWPFELLAQSHSFLLPHELHLIRQFSDWGAAKKYLPKNRSLRMLFMACSAMDSKPELDFEKEEETIFLVTENLAVDMEVEDSGSIEGLRYQLEREEYDVLHLSGHFIVNKGNRPVLIMEDETGTPNFVLPDQLWNDALIENPPRLLFLSGCYIGETAHADINPVVLFAKEVATNNHGPAVLCWGRSVFDEQSILCSKMIYKELSRGKTILGAIKRARYELITRFPSNPEPAWALLRLFSSGESFEAIVKKDQKYQQKERVMKHIHLRQSHVQVLEVGFVGRRRQLQQSLRALKHSNDKFGVFLHGTGGLGKSCLAGKIIERLPGHIVIIVHGKLNAVTMERSLRDAFKVAQDKKGEMILAAKVEMAEKLGKLCATSFLQQKYLLLLDDFDQNLEGAEEDQPALLSTEAVDLLTALLYYLPSSGKMTQVIITSRYTFSLTKNNRDIVEKQLELVCLTSLQPAEQRKKERELKNILSHPEPSRSWLLAEGCGNPLLLEWLNNLVEQVQVKEIPQLQEIIKNKQKEFIKSLDIWKLIKKGGHEFRHFLNCFSIYRKPVQLEGVQYVAEKSGSLKWMELLKRGIRLSLIEHDHTCDSYSIIPLIKKDILHSIDESQLKLCHQAACKYYKSMCETMEQANPNLVEECIFHALGCGEEEEASRQGGVLVNYFRGRLAFQESLRVGEWILEKKTKGLFSEHDASLLNELAYTIGDLGDYKSAISYYEQSLAIWRGFKEQRSRQVASVMNNLGSAWYSLGDYQKAITYYEQAIALDQTVFESESPGVAICLNNLGSAWKAVGDFRKAIGYYKKSLAILRRVYGKNNPHAITGLNNLGMAWYSHGYPQKAISYYKQALAIWKDSYSDLSPEVAAVFNNLGSVYHSLNDYRKALLYYEQGLDSLQKIFGEQHPQVATGLSNLGSTYFIIGNKEKAKNYFEKAYSIFHTLLGKYHPDTIAVKEWLTACK
jgi:tetratricopeptide (TPR) repeat protein